MRGRIPDGPVLLFDDDAFYIGSVMAEVLRAAGREVIYVTPDDVVASWTIVHAGVSPRAEAPALARHARSSPGTTSLPSTAMERNWSAYTAAANGA